ncbi:type III effector [Herbaspirillum huttiense]|uniref:Type III effector n=2 Tax=Herbaspirillum huttiense TaxID=863372 RepID=A0AAJ2H589_9BURK|nr:type III effector [Herbaspirillum huttiense]MDR9834071.1 type III effector [Herbaspirillum huttiense]
MKTFAVSSSSEIYAHIDEDFENQDKQIVSTSVSQLPSFLDVPGGTVLERRLRQELQASRSAPVSLEPHTADSLFSLFALAIEKSSDIRDQLLEEKRRVHWHSAGTLSNKIEHKAQSLIGMRTAVEKAKDFVKFMTEFPCTMTDLGDGWIRASRMAKGKNASIDFRKNSDGEIVQVRRSPIRSGLPIGKEREAYSKVLEELQIVGRSGLRDIPIYYANRNTRGYGLPTHGYVLVGTPNRGRHGGAVLYGVGGDPKRGQVNLDAKLLKNLTARSGFLREYKLSEVVRSTLLSLAGRAYMSREDFYRAYAEARGESIDSETIYQEVRSIFYLLPKTSMELWTKQTGDYRTPNPAAPERDIRAFERLPRDLGRRVVLKKISGVKSINLQEARRQFLLHRLYQDEQFGRNGTGVPDDRIVPQSDLNHLNSMAANTPKFQRLPPFLSDKVGNCNAGAATLLQSAIDRDHSAAQTYKRVRPGAASWFGIGANHRIALWDPLKNQSDQ